jgi:hypothetical protein
MSNTTLTPAALAELERLAREATPGKREVIYESCECGGEYPCQHEDYAYELVIPERQVKRHPKAFPNETWATCLANFADGEECTNADAEFIAACDRETVLALLTERDALAERVRRAEEKFMEVDTEAEGAHQSYLATMKRLQTKLNTIRNERDTLRADLAAAHSQLARVTPLAERCNAQIIRADEAKNEVERLRCDLAGAREGAEGMR